jgi:GxxExxY protein
VVRGYNPLSEFSEDFCGKVSVSRLREGHNPGESMILEKETYHIRQAIFEVNREMGTGFLENVYQECLMAELRNCSIPFVPQPSVKIRYKGLELSHPYIPDFICYGNIIVEIKSVKTILPEHQAQILNYLKATKHKLGLLVNFGTYPKAQIQRFLYSADRFKHPRG